MLFTSLTASSHMSCSHTRNSNLKYQVQGQVVRTLATAAAPLLYHYHCQRRFAVARLPPGSITGQRLFFFKPTVNVWPFVLQNWVPPPELFSDIPLFLPPYVQVHSPFGWCGSIIFCCLYYYTYTSAAAGPWLEGGMAGSVTSSFPSCMMGAGRSLSLFLLQPRAAAPTMLPPSLSAHSPPNGKFEAVSNEPWTGTGPRPLMPKEAEY